MARNVQTGIRNATLIIKDASSPMKQRKLLCHGLSIPVPANPEFIKDKPEGELVGVHLGADVESTLSFSVGLDKFLASENDPTEAPIADIITKRGAGAAWTPINNLMTIPVPDRLRCFTFEFHLDATDAGGLHTVRTVQAYVAPPVQVQRGDTTVMEFSGEVWGSITDTMSA